MKNSKIIRKIFAPFASLLIVILLVIPLLSSCFLFGPSDESSKIDVESSSSSEEQNKVESGGETIAQDKEPAEVSSEQEEGDEGKITQSVGTEEGTTTDTLEKLESKTISIKVYYVDEQAQYLIGEERKISGKTKEELVVAAFNELLKSPQQENVYNLIPQGTKIIGAECVDDYVILNLSKEFIENKQEDGLVDFLVLNCISATITEVPGVKGVLFEIEGEKIDVYGTIDVSIPVKRNEDLLK